MAARKKKNEANAVNILSSRSVLLGQQQHSVAPVASLQTIHFLSLPLSSLFFFQVVDSRRMLKMYQGEKREKIKEGGALIISSLLTASGGVVSN